MIPVDAPDSEKEYDCGCGLNSEDIASLTNGKPLTDNDWRQTIQRIPCRTCGEEHRHNFTRRKPGVA